MPVIHLHLATSLFYRGINGQLAMKVLFLLKRAIVENGLFDPAFSTVCPWQALPPLLSMH
jgi:hypothetical protein